MEFLLGEERFPEAIQVVEPCMNCDSRKVSEEQEKIQ